MRTPFLLVACALGAALPLSATAGDHGLRVSVAATPTNLSHSGSSVTGTGDADSARRVSLMYTFLARPARPASFFLSTGVDFSTTEYALGTEEQRGARFEAGASFRLTDQARMELTAGIGAGSTTMKSDADSSSEDGTYLDFGIMLRPVYQFESGVSVAGEVGYTRNVSVYDYGLGDDGDWVRRGITAGVAVGYTFR